MKLIFEETEGCGDIIEIASVMGMHFPSLAGTGLNGEWTEQDSDGYEDAALDYLTQVIGLKVYQDFAGELVLWGEH